MNDLEKLVAALAAQGFYPVLKYGGSLWRCDLFNNVMHCAPWGAGKTAWEAVQAALADRDQRKAA